MFLSANIYKNFYILTGVFFLFWMLFFDGNDVFTQSEKYSKINDLKSQKVYYQEKIKNIQIDIEELRSNEVQLEKFARERYLMKKKKEDVYVVVPQVVIE